MIVVDNIKYACQKCIQGHRSSRCDHTERKLFIVKRKGRPVSQCETCRAKRQSSKVHQKCSCPKKYHNKNKKEDHPSTMSTRHIMSIDYIT